MAAYNPNHYSSSLSNMVQKKPSYADYASIQNYAKPMALTNNGTVNDATMFSANPGFDWGGATAQGAPDWSSGYGQAANASGGFDGYGLNKTGIFGGLFDGLGDSLKSSGFLGSTDANGIKTDGWSGTALGGITAALGAYGAMNSKKNADRMYGLQKDAYETNKQANIATTNTRYSDRQAARVASNPTAYESVDAYMNKNRIA